MTIEHIHMHLNKGKVLGIQYEPPDARYVGWISIEKQAYNPKILQLYSNEPDSYHFKEQKKIEEKPYLARICEISRTALEGENHPRSEDYKRNDVYRFHNLFDIEEFLQPLGYSFSDLKWYSDILHD
jgi:hypothetical protein